MVSTGMPQGIPMTPKFALKPLFIFCLVSVQIIDSVLVYRDLTISTNSGTQRQQHPIVSVSQISNLSLSLWSWDLRDDSNPTLKEVPFVSPQLVAKIGSLRCTKLGFLSWHFIVQGLPSLSKYFPSDRRSGSLHLVSLNPGATWSRYVPTVTSHLVCPFQSKDGLTSSANGRLENIFQVQDPCFSGILMRIRRAPRFLHRQERHILGWLAGSQDACLFKHNMDGNFHFCFQGPWVVFNLDGGNWTV